MYATILELLSYTIARILGFLLGSILGSPYFWKLPYGVNINFTGSRSSEFASRLPRHLRKKACTMWVLVRHPLPFWGSGLQRT